MIWLRIKLKPFQQTISKPDKKLSQKLEKEMYGILSWAVEGSQKWIRNGFGKNALNSPLSSSGGI